MSLFYHSLTTLACVVMFAKLTIKRTITCNDKNVINSCMIASRSLRYSGIDLAVNGESIVECTIFVTIKIEK